MLRVPYFYELDNNIDMHYEMKLNDRPFHQIESGMKTIEMRVDKGERKNLLVGDTITFMSRTDGRTITTEILALHRFRNFKELYSTLSMDKCGYTQEEAETSDWRDMLEYYTEDEINLHGVVGIELKLI